MLEALDTITRQGYGFSRVISLPYEDAVKQIKEKLKEQGFGVLAEIDVRAAMKEKLNVDFPKYVILGACNPQLAHRALQAEPRLGLLLPCNVVVRQVGGGTEVSTVDADAMLALVNNPELAPIAKQANQLLQNALKAL